MNVKQLFVAVAVLTAGSAFAESTYPFVEHSSFASTRTRAQVQAELADAGTVVSRQEFVEHRTVASGKTRAEVRAELARLHAEGTHVAGGSPEFVEHRQVASTRSREEVGAEATEAQRAATPGASNSGS